MFEIIKIKGASYERYEGLLLKREQLYRESESILISYTQEFGILITEIFEIKIECIKLKKSIAYCQMMINRQEPVDVRLMDEYLEKQMDVYYAQLQEMLMENEAAKKAVTVSIFDVERAKKIYRRLAKQLHPDINPLTEEVPQLRELWERITIAYHATQPKELAELEVLVKKVVEELDIGTCEIEIPNIEEKICELEEEIHEILTTEPYVYNEILNDSEKILNKKTQLETEKAECQDYQKELEELLHQMMAEEGGSFLWKMD